MDLPDKEAKLIVSEGSTDPTPANRPNWLLGLLAFLQQPDPSGRIPPRILVRDDPHHDDFERAIFIGNKQFSDLKEPWVVVQVENVDHIQKCVQFLSTDNDAKGVPISVKNGGHSYAGYCLNKDGVVIDMSLLRHVSLHFPAPPPPATNIPKKTDIGWMTLDAGLRWRDVYPRLPPGVMVIGGQCPGVGVTGFTLGGGLSPFTRSFGLAVDNVLEIQMVNAKAELVTVTAQSDQKLFWALLGGGGGNFGIVTRFKTKLHRLKTHTVVCGNLVWDLTHPKEMEEFHTVLKNLDTKDAAAEEWKYNHLCIDPVWNYRAGKYRGMLTILFNGPFEDLKKVLVSDLGVPEDKVQLTVTPPSDKHWSYCFHARDFLQSLRPLEHKVPDWTDNELRTVPFSDWEVFEEKFDPHVQVNHHHVSFVLPHNCLGKVVPLVTELMAKSPALVYADDKSDKLINKCHILWDHCGGTSLIENKDSCFAWRKGVYFMTAKVQWSNASDKEKAKAWTQECSKVLAPFAIDGVAAYLNYIDPDLEDWRKAYYGSNYDELLRIKKEHDPEGFFNRSQFPQSIGYEGPAPGGGI